MGQNKTDSNDKGKHNIQGMILMSPAIYKFGSEKKCTMQYSQRNKEYMANHFLDHHFLHLY
jgi:hypothetical protein